MPLTNKWVVLKERNKQLIQLNDGTEMVICLTVVGLFFLISDVTEVEVVLRSV